MDQGVHYQIAMALANTPESDELETDGWRVFGISQKQWKSVRAVLKWRYLPPQEQAAP